MKGKEVDRTIVMRLICLLLISLCGCDAMIKEMDKPYHEFAWYQPGKTIEQARRDCDECIYEIRKTPYPSQSLFEQCMNLRGYQLYSTGQLLNSQIPIQEVAGWNSFGMHNDVAGK